MAREQTKRDALQMQQLQIDDALQDFGLTAPEATVYRVLLSGSGRPATVIAERAGLKRGHCYNVLRALISKGLVQDYLKGGVRQFAGNPPTVLERLLKKQEEQLASRKHSLEEMLPVLLEFHNPSSVAPKMRLFQGLEGVREIYEDMLQFPNSAICALQDVQYDPLIISSEDNRWLKSYFRRRAAKDISWFGIFNRSFESDQAARFAASVPASKYYLKLIEGIELRACIAVYGPKIAVTSGYKDTLGFIVESDSLADSLRNLHQSVWGFLPNYPA